MNQASSRSRTRPSRRPSRRTRKRAPTSLPRWVPRRTRRSISGTAPTRQPRSATAARHSQPWPRRNRDRFGLAAWLWCTSEPGARLEIRSTTVSSMTTCQTGGANNSSSTPSSARQTASHVQRPRWRNQESVVQERDSPAARIASVTWPPRVVAAPSSSSVKVVRARRGTASAGRPTSVVRIGGAGGAGLAPGRGGGGPAGGRARGGGPEGGGGEGGGGGGGQGWSGGGGAPRRPPIPPSPDPPLTRPPPPRLAPHRQPRHAH